MFIQVGGAYRQSLACNTTGVFRGLRCRVSMGLANLVEISLNGQRVWRREACSIESVMAYRRQGPRQILTDSGFGEKLDCRVSLKYLAHLLEGGGWQRKALMGAQGVHNSGLPACQVSLSGLATVNSRIDVSYHKYSNWIYYVISGLLPVWILDCDA